MIPLYYGATGGGCGIHMLERDGSEIKYACFYRSCSQLTHQQHRKISDPHIFVKNELGDLNNSILNVSAIM